MSDSKAASTSKGDGKRTSPVTFYRQVVAELRKVVWPSQHQLTAYFAATMVFVCALMLFISLLDLGFGQLVFEIFGGAGN